MTFEPRVHRLRDFRLLRKPARDFESILAVTFHAQGERFQPAHRKETVERSRYRADRVLQKLHLVCQFAVRTNYSDAADHVGMAVEVFRGGMNDQVESEFERPLGPRTGEGVVRNTDDVARLRRTRDRLEINQLEE